MNENLKKTLDNTFSSITTPLNGTLVHKATRSPIISLLTPQEAVVFKYLGSLEVRDKEADRILEMLQKKLVKLLSPKFLIIHHTFSDKDLSLVWPVRRPLLLEIYDLPKGIYLAISERVLLTAREGLVEEIELGAVPDLPPPSKNNSFKRACSLWSMSTSEVSDLVEEKFRKKDYVPQEDVFQENELNILRYESGAFLNTTPARKPGEVTFRIEKGRKDESSSGVSKETERTTTPNLSLQPLNNVGFEAEEVEDIDNEE